MTPLEHYTVSQIRVAATCPRIHYFDAVETRARRKPTVTRIWTSGDGQAAGGALFHRIIEGLNRQAAAAPDVLDAIRRNTAPDALARDIHRYINTNCIDLPALAKKSVVLRQNLIAALEQYVGELSQIIVHAIAHGNTPEQVITQLFGDSRRRVDVTFRVAGVQAHVVGQIDYVFYDWRIGRHRIFDYKLTPPTSPEKDLFQIHTYALMHHHQHQTRPDLAVFYLHPERKLFEARWEDVYAGRHTIYGLLASMVGWSHYDETTGDGLKPPGNPSYCDRCPWSANCEARLGPKSDGARDSRWEELASARHDAAPTVDVRVPPAVFDDDRSDDDDDASVDPARAPANQFQLAATPIPALTMPAIPSPGAVSAVARRVTARPLAPAAPTLSVPDSVIAPPIPAPTIAPQVSFPLTASPVPSTATPSDALITLGGTGTRTAALHASSLNTHVAVVGAAGSGKTWMAKVIAEGVVAAGIPLIAIDPQGDLVQFLSRKAASEIPAEHRDLYQQFCDRVEPRVFTPGTSHGIRLSLDPIRVPSSDELGRVTNPERRAEHHQAMLSAVAANLTSLASVGGEVESQRTFLYQVISQLPQSGTMRLGDIIAALRDPEAFGISEPDHMIKKPEREKLARRLYSYVEGPSAALFTGGMRLDLDRMVVADKPGRTPLNVIYLNALTDDDQKHFFLAALASEIYRWMITSLTVTDERPNLVFYLDEARDYIPAGTRKPPAKEPLIRLFTQGRKFGVGCLLCTQSPRSVDYNVFGNCSTKIVGRLESAQDAERVAEWFGVGGTTPAWVAERKGAVRGSFVGRWPGMPPELEGVEFHSRALFSTHEGAWSPDRVEHAVDATKTREEDSAPS